MAAPKKQEKDEGAPNGRVVLAALITAKCTDGQIRYFRKGDVLPDVVTEESLAHLASLGFISE